VLDASLSGPCSLVSPSFPIALGTISEETGEARDVTVHADDVGTCRLTATLTSDRSNPPPSSASVDIVDPAPLTSFFSGLMAFFGLSGPDTGTPAEMVVDPGLLASESPSPTFSEPTASPGPEVTSVPEGTPTAEGSEVLPPDPATPEPTLVLEGSPTAEGSEVLPVSPPAPTAVPPEPTAPPEPAPGGTEPTPEPLVVSQGSLMADPGSPLAWVLLSLFGVWFGRQLVFRVRVPAPRSRREARYDEPATRPHR
jgi:hypothetical protein